MGGRIQGKYDGICSLTDIMVKIANRGEYEPSEYELEAMVGLFTGRDRKEKVEKMNGFINDFRSCASFKEAVRVFEREIKERYRELKEKGVRSSWMYFVDHRSVIEDTLNEYLDMLNNYNSRDSWLSTNKFKLVWDVCKLKNGFDRIKRYGEGNTD
jgi:hypothetical protein